jgi:ribosomal protein L11 methylase PrmA
MDDAQVPAPAGQPSMLGASFRDPSGFLFRREGVLYRQVNQAYHHDYAQLIDSGLYRDLVKSGLLIPHQEVKASPAIPELAFKIIQPEPIEFISYPYEWSFSQLKDAALLTLKVQQRAMQSDMSLKDSSAYNVQFHRGRPVLIDTLSFERYPEGKPWIAYRQFCQHFLAPLSLMSLRDIRLSQLLRIYIDGVPLDLASSLLPARSRLSLPLLLHIHLHASTQKRYAAARIETSRQVSRTALLGLIDSLETGIKRLRWEAAGTEWGDYYDHTNYTPEGFQHKKQLVSEYLDQIRPASVWDLGANTGVFSRLSSEKSAFTLAFDIDPAAIEKGYLDCRARGEKRLLPLVLDLTNPSPGLGWRNQERTSLLERGPADAILALALVHHLAIANNVPLDSVADFLARAGRWLVIEFVPKSDSQVQRLLANRQDIFPDYSVEGFERAFASRFITRRAEAVRDSERRLYLMERLA